MARLPAKRGVTASAARKMILALPGVTERVSYGTPSWSLGKKFIARFRDHHTLVVVNCGDFGTMHAIVLVPIWSRLLGGLPFTIAGAAAATWCFTELRRGPWQSWPWLRAGLAFGLGAWLALLPVTAAGIGFRTSGLHAAHGDLETTLEFMLAALTGGALGWCLLRTRRGALAAATFLATLLAVQAGLVPVGNGRRPMIVFLSLAVIYSVCGLGLSAIAGRAARTSAHSPDHS